MKKVILSAVFAAGIFAANAQTSQGTISVGGEIGFSSTSNSRKDEVGGTTTKIDGTSFTRFTILPTVQYFIIDRLSVGLKVGYSSLSSNNNATPNVKTTSGAFEIMPFGRYYYMLDEKVGFFGQVGVPLSFGTNKSESTTGSTTTTSENSTSSLGIQLAPGFIFFPSKKIGLELSLGNILGINSYSQKADIAGGTRTDSQTTLSILNINTMGLNVGLSYYFGR